ncbi:DNA repair ATPase [Actinoplanes sp. N902-109]|uniref:DNA repair ATPase n=1 Tax=Actinoplanes sp. (strain N902-109) TaxID=649831 RepID=UPI0003293975|nr:DNA repair ATPase [Actinoplanes sp. N902-109]AGL21498.1 hypothetical protein L083_7988 [Actinoplanes sp. N902-109]
MTATLDAGTYEVLRARLGAHAKELAAGAETLNARRTATFGGQQMRLLGTERIRTGNNCVARDAVQVGGALLLGCNVFVGLRSETTVADVFAVHRLTDGTFQPATVPGLLDDPAFQRDFAELYRYYRGTRLLQLRRWDGLLLAVFQTGARADDLKVLRWRLGTDGSVSYQDNRGERDHVFPPAHDFEWTPTTREQHVLGRHPHVSIEDEVFVEAVGGTLTVKVENNTEDGEGIYAEPVDEPLQSLADAEIAYARIGALILVRVLPYKEDVHRYLVFHTRTRDVVRLDGIGQACRRLPDDQGIIFPGGCYLATGTGKTFDADVSELEFERVVRSVNGEDVLYVFHARATGRYLLLPYNVIRKEVAGPITCHGWSLFEDGTLVVFRAGSDEPARVHPVQIWQTPYVADTYAAAQPVGTGPLPRIGNADLVRGIADTLSVARMIDEMTPSGPVFEAIIQACTRITDTYHWIGDPELENLAAPLAEVRAAAGQVLAEFETVQELTAQAAAAVAETDATVTALIRRAEGTTPAHVDGWVEQLTALREAQGQVVTLREMRYADTARLDDLSTSLAAALDTAARRAVGFLQREEAFTGYRQAVDQLVADAAGIATVAEATGIAGQLTAQSDGLQVVTEVVGGLTIADATVRIGILERLGEVLGGVNRARATLDGRRRELAAGENRAAFAAEFTLLNQSVAGALALADTPPRCDEQVAKLMVQVEALESRFGGIDDFADQLSAKRIEVHEAFAARRQMLLDERTQLINRLVASAQRTVAAVQRQSAALTSVPEVNTYFATNPLVTKVREVADELRALGDPVRSAELDDQLQAARQEAARALRDRLDLYDADGTTITLGRHRFAVNTQPAELTLVPDGPELVFAITGTDYRAPVRSESFQRTRHFWDQPLVSESAELSRAEYRAACLFEGETEPGYDEGYERGVHDHDAALILAALRRLHADAGLLRYPARVRAAAQLFWAGEPEERRASWAVRAASLVRVRDLFGAAAELTELSTALAHAAGAEPAVGEYLVEELAATPPGFVTSAGARTFLDRFHRSAPPSYADDLRALADDPVAQRQLVHAWLTAFRRSRPEAGDDSDVTEAVAIELTAVERYESGAAISETVEGLRSVHPRIADGRLTVRLDEFLDRARRFRVERVPAFRAYQRERAALAAAERDRLRLAEHQPAVLSAFVRNRLLDTVYLPLIGDNLARQLGPAGGLLLLISPPGYGKTTVMEYVAQRLGLILVKVNGPALGHAVTSLDPAQAPDATARQEVEKISFALEMGTNVLLYLDDIQHTSPELLQKFVSLCDGQRRMEGVWDGRTRTFDLRGKRFAVCMAGNPYTESGRRFRIPDMLANRADVWNLGDVLSGREDVFEMSYLENALTANPVLAPLAARDRADLPLLVRLAEGDDAVRPDRLSHRYSAAELSQVLSVLRKMVHVQRVVLRVNRAYIASAGQADGSRTEPPFQLQGSYRNMIKLAGRIIPAMNADELEVLLDDHYLGEAQTLTSGAEANLLKLAELRGRLTPGQQDRWAEVKAAFLRDQARGGPADDPMTRAIGAIDQLSTQLAAVEQAIRDGRG